MGNAAAEHPSPSPVSVAAVSAPGYHRSVPRLLALATLALSACTMANGDPVPMGDKVGKDCKLKGKKLYGDVKVVDSFPDFEVKRVDAFADLHVKVVDAFPDACGRWRFVDSFPDFTIKYVDAFPDFTIKNVDAFPGVP